MKFKISAVIILLILASSTAYSSGALRHFLPFLTSIGSENLKEGEIAYDNTNKLVVYKNNTSVIPLANNPDTSYQNSFPIIETNTQQLFSTNMYANSYIHPGKIRIGNKIFSNSGYTRCIFNDTTSTTGWGHHDGSTNTVTIPSGFRKPLYLYLAEDGAGFKCIYSHKSDGPISPYNTVRWMRAASFAGQGGYFRTVAGYTSSSNTTVTFPPYVPYTNDSHIKYKTKSNKANRVYRDTAHVILPSMRSLKLGALVCISGEYFNLEEADNTASAFDDSMGITYNTIAYCGGTEPVDYYPYDSTMTGYGNTIGNVDVPIRGWIELPLSSI